VPLKPRVQLFFFDERVSIGKVLCWTVPGKGDQVLILQTQVLRVEQEKEPYIRVNIRELNRELCTRSSILYT